MRINANLATYKGRKDILPRAVESLKNQSIGFDEIRIYSNDYTPDIECVTIQTGKDLKDNGKFYWIPEAENEIYFTCDDDILYPPFYVEFMLEKLIQYPKCIISMHGRKLKGKGLNYYKDHTSYHFGLDVFEDHIIDVPGSGVMVFNTKYFKPIVWDSLDQCMVDVLIGLEAAKQNVEVVCVGHPSGWMQSMRAGGAIYYDHVNDCDRQSELCDDLWDIKY